MTLRRLSALLPFVFLAWLFWPRSAKAAMVASTDIAQRIRGKLVLTDSDIAELCYSVGFRASAFTARDRVPDAGDDLVTAIRIVLGESGGNVRARNPGSTATGLFQILAHYHPAVTLTDPVANAQTAFAMYSARKGFYPDWWGPTHFHTLKAGVPDRGIMLRAVAAATWLARQQAGGTT